MSQHMTTYTNSEKSDHCYNVVNVKHGPSLKQCDSREAGVQHSDVCDPPAGRLPESLGGNGQQKLCPHRRGSPGVWQAETPQPLMNATWLTPYVVCQTQ